MADSTASITDVERPAEGPQRHLVSECNGWTVAEYLCTAGPEDRRVEERHEAFTMAAVIEGTFQYRTNAGKSLLHPGSWLLGNHGECFACGHDHSRGDRCVALHITPQYFAEVAAGLGATSRFRFYHSMIPAGARELSLLARTCSIAARPDQFEMQELVTGILEIVIGQIVGGQPKFRAVSARDEWRISEILHHVEDHFADLISLEDLAEQAAMSKCHFLRTFRSLIGRSPYQYLINLRLQRSAHLLVNSVDSVVDVATNCGFGDLSTLGSQFRRQFGESPSRFRAKYALKSNARAIAVPSAG